MKTPSKQDSGPEHNCLLLVHKPIFYGILQMYLRNILSSVLSQNIYQWCWILLRNTLWRHEAQDILAAFHKKQERFLVIAAMKRTRENHTSQNWTSCKYNFSCQKSMSGQTWPYNSYKTDTSMRLMSQSGSVTVAPQGTDNSLHKDFFIG